MYLHEKRDPSANKSREKRRLAKKKEQSRNNKGQFTSSSKNTREKETDLNVSIVSDEEFDCYNKSEGKPVQTNIDDELQLLPKNNKLTPGQGIYKGKNKISESQTSVRKSNRLPFAKQTEKLGSVPFQTNNNKKKQIVNGNVLQEKTATTTKETEDENHRLPLSSARNQRNPYNTAIQQRWKIPTRTNPERGM